MALFISLLSAHAEELIDGEIVDHFDEKDWIITSTLHGSGYEMTVIERKTKKELMKYNSDAASHSLVDTTEAEIKGYASPLLVTRWTYGAHSEKLIVFDPVAIQKKELFSVLSAFSPAVTVSDDHLEIEISEQHIRETGLGPKIKEKTVEWSPSKGQKVIHEDFLSEDVGVDADQSKDE